MRKTYAISVALVALFLVYVMPVVAAYPYPPDSREVEAALEFLARAQKPDGSIGSYGDSAWAVMAISAAGRDKFEGYGGDFNALMNYLKNNWPADPSACDYARTILAVVAADEDPRHFVTPTGTIDLVAGLTAFYDGTKIYDPAHDWAGGAALNDDWWAIMALISAGVKKDSEIIQNIASYILSHQNTTDGGWGWAVGRPSDVDNTAAAIMGLIAAGNPDPTAVQNGLNYLRTQQLDSGGFGSIWTGDNVGSTAWAICAIWAAGEDPTDWNHPTTGKNPVDDLLRFQNWTDSTGYYIGAFAWWGSQWLMAEYGTASALPALLGKPYPIKSLPEEWETASVESATGAGRVIFTVKGDLGNLEAVDESTLPTEGKPDLRFPYGFFSFSISGLTPGATVEVTLIFPSNVPTNVQYWKYHEPEGWIQIPVGDNDGDRVITITLTDGGTGDDDGTANGVIVDPGGPGFPVSKPKPPFPVGGRYVPINRTKVLLASFRTVVAPPAALLAAFAAAVLIARKRRRK